MRIFAFRGDTATQPALNSNRKGSCQIVGTHMKFDSEKLVEYAKMRNPYMDILFASAKTGEGIPQLADWILTQMKNT